VSNNEVQMTTKLAGAATRFLPFNKGNNGAAGNPLNWTCGHRTAYLWEEVWERESWLEILGRYLVAEKDSKKQITNVISHAITSLMPHANYWRLYLLTAQAENISSSIRLAPARPIRLPGLPTSSPTCMTQSRRRYSTLCSWSQTAT
jgi:hypothetical protein